MRTTSGPSSTGIILRAVRPDDIGLMRSLFDEVRRPGFARVGLGDAALATLLDLQYDAFRAQHAEWYPGAVDRVIEADGESAGRALVHEAPDGLRIVNLAVAERLRGRGIATRALQHWIARADRARLPVTVKVPWDNPAVRLYKRLGFDHVSTDGDGQLLRRPPDGTAA